MKAARVIAPGRAEMVTLPVPEPSSGQVRLRLQACGICGSNIPVWEGREWFKYPLEPGSPGHEGVGWIDAVGAGVTGLKEGQRVVALSYHAFAEYDLADASAVVPVPERLADQIVLGEPLGCAINVARRCGFEAGQRVAVVGIGFLGAVLVQLARHAVGPGGRVVAISRRASALALARRGGADEAIPLDDRAKAAAEAANEGHPFDVVIEGIGMQEPLDLAADLVRERGRLVIAGYHQDGPRRVNMQSWNWRGIDVINAHERDAGIFTEGMRLAVEAVADERLEIESLLTHRYPLERIGEAFEAARLRPDGFLKAIVMMDSAEGGA